MYAIESTFLLSLVGTLLWLTGLWLTPRSARLAAALQLGSTTVFALLNASVGAYPGLVGGALGAVLLVRAIRGSGGQRSGCPPLPAAVGVRRRPLQ
jgi:hypothetical protein